MFITKLDWDSDFFGYKVGLLNSGGQFDESSLKDLTDPFRLVYITSPTPIRSPELTCGDSKQVYGKKPMHHGTNSIISEARIDQLEQLSLIGLQSGVWSRFALDGNFINGEFNKLYSKWVERSVRQEIAYEALTCIEEGQPVGLITLRNNGEDSSSIGLFAVLDTQRGKGIGKQLLQAVDTISFERGDAQLTVSTQGKNNLAREVYTRFGFEMISETYVYNYWNESYEIQ